MSLTESQIVFMDSAVAKLRNALAQAFAHVGSLWTPQSTKDAINGALRIDGDRIERLNGSLRTDVQANRLGFENWKAIAQTTAEDIQAQSGYSTSWGNFWTQVVQQTATDTKGALPSEGKVQVYIGLAIVALVLILAIKVT